MTLRVLLIEDDDHDAALIMRALRRGGVECLFDRATNGDEAEAALSSTAYGVVLCDVTIPNHAPDRALDLLRIRAQYTPLIVLSGVVRIADAISYLRAGAEDFIAKDELERLVPAVQRALREAGLRADNEETQRSLRESRARLEAKQQLEAVGLVAGTIAHDINNLLTAIIYLAESATENLEGSMPELADDLREIADAAWRAAALPRQLLIFTRQERLEARTFRLNRRIASMDRLLATVGQSRNEVVLDLCANDDVIDGDPAQIEQVVINLVSNARDALPKGGRITLATRDEGDRVVLSVTDTGVGIDPSLQARIFEPFFTTKEAGRGTGLGLSSCLAVVEAMQGELTLRSELGQGTEVTIRFPRSQMPCAEDPVRKAFRQRHTAQILAVIHQPELRRSLVRLLEQQGYLVTLVGRRAEAEALLAALPYSLVIAQDTLPDGDGRGLVSARGGLLLSNSTAAATDGLRVLGMPLSATDLLSTVSRLVSGD